MRVECYAGYQADERPARLDLGGTLVDVERIEDRWYSPGASFFRVVVTGGDRYLLRHELGQDLWSIEGFRARPSASSG